jgi:AcrR family transcriptional regulator
MVDIAAEADIGRTTLYRHFKSRDEILIQAIVRDIAEIFDSLQACIDRQSNLEDRIVEGFLFCLEEFRRRPVLALMLNQKSLSLLGELGLNADALHETGLALTRPIYEEAREQHRLRGQVELDEFVEWITRILLSLQMTPSKYLDSQISARQFLRKFLISSLLTDQAD